MYIYTYVLYNGKNSRFNVFVKKKANFKLNLIRAVKDIHIAFTRAKYTTA